MLEFLPLTYENLPRLTALTEKCDYRICGYAPTCKIMWGDFYNSEYAISCDCLIYKNTIFDKIIFNYPIPFGPDADERAALSAIENYCVEKYIPLVFMDIPQEKMSIMCERYSFMEIGDDRNYNDYLYLAEDFRAFSGKKFSGQRNHIHKFLQSYPNAQFRSFTSEDKSLIKEFLNEYLIGSESMEKNRETGLSEKLLLSLPLEKYRTGGYVLNGKVISFTFGSRMGDTLFVHIEKGLKEYEGVYTATANAFAKANGDADFINREDDSGARGLRISKTQYHPVRLVKKFFITVRNEWQKIRRFPTIKTERLVLDGIKKGDARAYYDICVDDERNIYWGYDYKKDLKGDLYPEYFFDVQKADLKNKMCFSFAIRLDGKMIGEGVLYRFTGTGQAEAGIRIGREYAGKGYGKEAFYAMVEWALYRLGLKKVVSKCYHENNASYKMLSERMKITGKDRTFTYFEKTV